jgi:hypothetical protein
MVPGERNGAKRKPDPSSAWEILLELGLTPRELLLKAGAQRVIDEPEELLTLIGL